MLDRAKCKKMLVWDENESDAIGLIVIDIAHNGWCTVVKFGYEDDFLNGKEYNTSNYRHCKPIPDQKPVTILDVMYKAGIRDVARFSASSGIFSVLAFISDCSFENYVYNTLIKENGKVKLKHETWLTAEQYVRGE